jgi:hypothetical protein
VLRDDAHNHSPVAFLIIARAPTLGTPTTEATVQSGTPTSATSLEDRKSP